MLNMLLSGSRATLAILWRTVLFFLVFALIGGLFIIRVASMLSEWEETSRIGGRLYPDLAGAVAMLAAT